MYTIVGICGYGFTGSGAVIDLLRNCPNTNYLDVGEFNLAYFPDGLEDLEFHLTKQVSRFLSSDVAISRFLKRIDGYCKYKGYNKQLTSKIKQRSECFVNEITQVSWPGFWGFDEQNNSYGFRQYYYRFCYKFLSLRKRVSKGKLVFPERLMRLSVNPDSLNDKFVNYIEDVLCLLGLKENTINIIDQPFSADNPIKSFKYFNNPKAIIVDRDPRDLYILAKNTLGKKSSWIPVNNVQDFIDYYRILRVNASNNDSRILRVKFESLVYEYEKTIELISSFLGIAVENIGLTFDPNVSINNTQLFLACDDCYRDDIKLIENELMECLFPFENFSLKPNNCSTAF